VVATDHEYLCALNGHRRLGDDRPALWPRMRWCPAGRDGGVRKRRLKRPTREGRSTITEAGRLIVTEAVGRAYLLRLSGAECHRAAATTLRALFPSAANRFIIVHALLIVLDYMQ
jgi:hypothetical protein